MATQLQDLDRYFSPGLTLTVLGRTYTVPLPSAELGLWCRRAAEAAGAIKAAASPEEMEAAVARVNALPRLPDDLTLPERVLGMAYTAMVVDKVPDPYIQFCTTTAYVWIIAGDEAAERYWTSGGRPEAMARGNRAERRAAERTGGTSTAAAVETLPPASTSGTTSRRRSSGSGRGHPSRGRRS